MSGTEVNETNRDSVEGSRSREGMSHDEGVDLSLRVQDRIDLVARQRELKGRVALFIAAAAVAMGLVEFTGSWLGLLALLPVPYFLWRMTRAQSELRMLESEDEARQL